MSKAREKARQISCASNLKQIAFGNIMYCDEYKDWLCSSASNSGTAINGILQNMLGWPYQIYQYIGDFKAFECPSSIVTRMKTTGSIPLGGTEAVPSNVQYKANQNVHQYSTFLQSRLQCKRPTDQITHVEASGDEWAWNVNSGNIGSANVKGARGDTTIHAMSGNYPFLDGHVLNLKSTVFFADLSKSFSFQKN